MYQFVLNHILEQKETGNISETIERKYYQIDYDGNIIIEGYEIECNITAKLYSQEFLIKTITIQM